MTNQNKVWRYRVKLETNRLKKVVAAQNLPQITHHSQVLGDLLGELKALDKTKEGQRLYTSSNSYLQMVRNRFPAALPGEASKAVEEVTTLINAQTEEIKRRNRNQQKQTSPLTGIIHSRMTAEGVTLTELSKRLVISQQQISEHLNREKPFLAGTEIIKQILGALGYKADFSLIFNCKAESPEAAGVTEFQVRL